MARVITMATSQELDKLIRDYCTCGGTSLHEAHHAPDCTYRSLMEKIAADVERELGKSPCGRRYAHV
ncbi:hypothetical protein [Geobacter sp.]|uniref:hypothetical protein n=1 Tax=Geobacter sp. TaxID=46610 RepID=UPI002638D336|nr:hypothetical protein [Geobacter sp.]